MTFLLDTNIVSAHMKHAGLLNHRFFQYRGRIAVPTIVVGEFYAWAFMNAATARRLENLHNVLGDLSILTYDVECAQQFGRLRGILKSKDVTVPDADLMIASIALAHDLTLVTHNTADFQRIPNLRLDDWLAV
jgi:tRNA(fMet)-specific endonuclease VapC